MVYKSKSDSIMRMRYFHIRTDDCGNVTLAVMDAPNGGFYVGAALCSPSERNFSKKLGRQIAFGRVVTWRNHVHHVSPKNDDGSDTTTRDIIERSLREVVTPKTRPFWYDDFMLAQHAERVARRNKLAGRV